MGMIYQKQQQQQHQKEKEYNQQNNYETSKKNDKMITLNNKISHSYSNNNNNNKSIKNIYSGNYEYIDKSLCYSSSQYDDESTYNLKKFHKNIKENKIQLPNQNIILYENKKNIKQ